MFLVHLPRERRMELQMHLEALEGIAYPEDDPEHNQVRILCDPGIAAWVQEWLLASKEELSLTILSTPFSTPPPGEVAPQKGSL